MIYNNPLHINDNIICCFPTTIDDEFEFIIVIHYKEEHKKTSYICIWDISSADSPPPPTPSMLKRKQTF